MYAKEEKKCVSFKQKKTRAVSAISKTDKNVLVLATGGKIYISIEVFTCISKERQKIVSISNERQEIISISNVRQKTNNQ